MNSVERDYVVSYLTLRQMIGWIGLLMPFAVRLGAYAFEGIPSTGSISAYYYTGMRDVFVSTLVLIGALFACYRTPSWRDNLLATVAGIAAIGIGLFPMHPSYAAEIISKHPDIASGKCYLNRGLLGFHFLFVSIFFALACYLVYFRFSAFTPPNPTPQKRVRNRVYKICGAIMAVSSLAIAYTVVARDGESIFWPETVAVVSFAIAWLVKGQTIFLKDELPTKGVENAANHHPGRLTCRY